MLQLRDNQCPEQKKWLDEQIVKQLTTMLDQLQPGSVHCFLPIGSEVDIMPLIEYLLFSQATVVCPRSLPKRKMENLILKSIHELENGIFGTKHPANAKRFENTYDIIIVPGLAFDHLGNRVGYGAGYYDTFLIQHPDALKVGVTYSFQLVDKIPIEEHDIQMDKVIF
mgnify:CR=1 FL=1